MRVHLNDKHVDLATISCRLRGFCNQYRPRQTNQIYSVYLYTQLNPPHKQKEHHAYVRIRMLTIIKTDIRDSGCIMSHSNSNLSTPFRKSPFSRSRPLVICLFYLKWHWVKLTRKHIHTYPHVLLTRLTFYHVCVSKRTRLSRQSSWWLDDRIVLMFFAQRDLLAGKPVIDWGALLMMDNQKQTE